MSFDALPNKQSREYSHSLPFFLLRAPGVAPIARRTSSRERVHLSKERPSSLSVHFRHAVFAFSAARSFVHEPCAKHCTSVDRRPLPGLHRPRHTRPMNKSVPSDHSTIVAHVGGRRSSSSSSICTCYRAIVSKVLFEGKRTHHGNLATSD